MPCHHALAEALRADIDVAGIVDRLIDWHAANLMLKRYGEKALGKYRAQ